MGGRLDVSAWRRTGAVLVVSVRGTAREPRGFPRPIEPGRHRPDLVVSSIVDPPTDGTAVPSFSVSVSTLNTGTLSARPSVTRLFLSLDDQLGSADAVVGEVACRGCTAARAVRPPVVSHVPAAVALRVRRARARDATGRVQGTQRAQQLPGLRRDDLVRRRRRRRRVPARRKRSSPRTSRAGLIDFGTSLIYRVVAFRDSCLPERYDGSGSTGEDQSLFPVIDDLEHRVNHRAEGRAGPHLAERDAIGGNPPRTVRRRPRRPGPDHPGLVVAPAVTERVVTGVERRVTGDSGERPPPRSAIQGPTDAGDR